MTGYLTEITHGTMLTMVSQNTTVLSVGTIDITSIGDMGISTNAGCNITVTGDYKKKISGSAIEDYDGTLDETHDGVYKLYTGSDFHNHRAGGTDYANPISRGSSTASVKATEVS